MTLVQIERRTGLVERVPREQKPVVELDLNAGERVLNFALRERYGTADRKTVDWSWEADIEWRAA